MQPLLRQYPDRLISEGKFAPFSGSNFMASTALCWGRCTKAIGARCSWREQQQSHQADVCKRHQAPKHVQPRSVDVMKASNARQKTHHQQWQINHQQQQRLNLKNRSNDRHDSHNYALKNPDRPKVVHAIAATFGRKTKLI